MYRDWLKLRRDRLSDTDAEGHQSLATLYEELLQDRSTAIELLQKAYDDRSTGLVYLKVDPAWDGVRSDPRFAAMLTRVGLK